MALTSQWGSQIVVALEKAFDVAPLGAYTNIVQAARLLEDGNAQAANDWARTLPEYAEEWHLIEQLWGSAIRNAAHYGNHSYATELQSGFPRELAPRALEGSEPENTSIDRLSKRERQVGLLAEELSNPEIAERLHISKRTVENHISNALRKTESRDRVELSGRIRTAFPNSGD
ncbi:response regulator transcription factor [Leucobacter coleopterorum]|uniref:Response regulator transcription factor n=2 Tax=Leucobacter coleopterorum TaxID=2714933 RepID=A0ABX6K352_9MICO|nr:response regulator transcription factor [Leucobacter coleopterorum]